MAEQVRDVDSVTRTPRPRRRLRLLSVLVIAAVAAVVGTTVVIKTRTTTVSYPQVPPVGPAAPATCPRIWDSQAFPATRKGLLVPPGATEALLCSYPDSSGPRRLGATHRTTTDIDSLIDYLNSLPTSRRKGAVCSLSASTDHVVVFGYPNRQPAAVHYRNCAWDQSGAMRYSGDIKKITEYWGVPWNT